MSDTETRIARAIESARETAAMYEEMTGNIIGEEEILLTADYYLDKITREEFEARKEEIHRRTGKEPQDRE